MFHTVTLQEEHHITLEAHKEGGFYQLFLGFNETYDIMFYTSHLVTALGTRL